jgi:mRNA-degrading endonuclease toxin of MazEF toxin-antitoxin module
MSTAVLRRGHLYWARLDKRRPVLVISPDYRNEWASDVIVVPCSTVLRPAPTHVALRAREGGAPAPSVLKCEQITTLHQSDVDPAPMGRALTAGSMSEVERAILRAIGVPVAD